jgi:RHS repeat-associated protein
MFEGRVLAPAALLASVLGLMLCSLLLLPSLASAREYAPPPEGGGLVENPDGTWSFYGVGQSSPYRVYTSTEHESMERLGSGLELETGATGQQASEVAGITSGEAAAASELAAKLRTGALYRSKAEMALGNTLVATDEARKTLEPKARVMDYAGTVREPDGPFRVGVKIGSGMEELIAFPPASYHGELTRRDIYDETETSRNRFKHYHFLSEIEVYPRGPGKTTCEELLPYESAPREAALEMFAERGVSLRDYCERAAVKYEEWLTAEDWVCHEFGECDPYWQEYESGHTTYLSSASSGLAPISPCSPTWPLCFDAETGPRSEDMEMFTDINTQAQDAAFPSPEVGGLKTALEPEASELAAPEKLKAPVAPAEPGVAPTIVVEYMLYNEPELYPGIEGPGVPNPLRSSAREAETWGLGGSAAPDRRECRKGKPVNCANGNEVQTQTDLSIGGRGPTFGLSLIYNSALAASQTESGALVGPFGYGWTSSYSAHLELAGEGQEAIVHQDDGSAVVFTHSGEAWKPASASVEATLAAEGSGYLYTLPDQLKLHFNSSGQLTSEEDRNGNTLTINHNSEGRLESISDSSGRKITLAYNGEGHVESAQDPMGHAVKYAYEGGNLAAVTLPGEAKASWQYKYNSEHELTSSTDGREHTTTIEYNEAHQVVAQTDPLSRKRTWEYAATQYGSETTITEPNGSTTVEQFNEEGSPTSITLASGTSYAATTTDEYNSADELIAQTDPNNHMTEYSYDSTGDRTSEKNADGNERKWTYDSKHDVETETSPRGETTTIERDSHGNATKLSRPAPGETTQVTKYKYNSHGDVESMTDPLSREYKYEYDGYGDRTAETDPEGDKRTWAYNGDSQETSTVSPRGHAAGAKESNFTTKLERDAQGRLVKVTNPLKREAQYTYDADGNLETSIDLEGNETIYTYDADNEPTKTEEPDKAVTESEYNAEGRVVAQIDGNKHATRYTRNLLGEVTEETNPLSQKTTKEYDLAGNLTSVTDPLHRTTTYIYDPANRLTEVTYSDGKTPTAKYEYNADGERTRMIDGAGETVYTYDQLDRMTESKDGHGDTVRYEYDLANDPTKITYPNGKAVTRAYDKDARLESITDWNESTTSFAYDPDSDLKSITYPTSTSDVDSYTYENDDAMEETKMTKGSETLASLIYTRDKDTQLTKSTDTGVPGEEKLAFSYDDNSRLTKGAGIAYGYDSANNPTKIGNATYAYNPADELEAATVSKKAADTYTYNEAGERTKTTPTTGPATSYGYDQVGELIAVTRPKEGEIPAREDGYSYDGEGLRASETISGTTLYWTWDVAEAVPLLLSDGANSYIYGPDGLPVEQINNSTGAVLYLHHNQAGSTRLLTGSTGKTEGSYSYNAYGTPEHTGTATTPLGYDSQYTSSDTGLIYLRNRVYDPATAQFLTVDPLDEDSSTLAHATGEQYVAAALRSASGSGPYVYANDNPLKNYDPTGLFTVGICVHGEVNFILHIGASGCVQGSSSGEVGGTVIGSVGVAQGAGVGATVGPQVSNAEHISELSGPFANAGGQLGVGPDVSLEAFGAPGQCGPIVGGGVSAGAGLGVSRWIGGSYTGAWSVSF